MKYLSFIVLLASCGFGATLYVPTVSQVDFEDVYYNQSAPGDTIVLPAGSATWGNSGSYNQGVTYLSTDITVEGQGDSTIITLDDTGKTFANGVIWIGARVLFKSVKIVGSSVAPVTAFQIALYGSFTGGFRLADITYVGGTVEAYFCTIGAGVESGLIDHCRLTSGTGSAELIFGRGPSNAWSSPNKLGAAENIFIESNTFNGPGYVCDANSNARFVVRYNTITGPMKVDAHGYASNSSPVASVREIEVYNNTWTASGLVGQRAIELRGGTGMVFDNSSTNSSSSGFVFLLNEYGCLAVWANFGYGLVSASAANPTTITTSAPFSYLTGYPVYAYCGNSTPLINGIYTITKTGASTFTMPINVTVIGTGDYVGMYQTPFNYPITQQVGQGLGGIEPMYIWNNTAQGVDWAVSGDNIPSDAITAYRAETGNPVATFTMASVIVADRDYFKQTVGATFNGSSGVGRGTTAQMNAITPSLTGVGFWVTDQGSWITTAPADTSGQLYRWNGSSWVLFYTPYTYPHPLQSPKVDISVSRLNVGTLRF